MDEAKRKQTPAGVATEPDGATKCNGRRRRSSIPAPKAEWIPDRKIGAADKFKFLEMFHGDNRIKSASDQSVMFYILNHYNAGLGRAWPGLRRLAELTGRYRSTVHASVNRLESFGYIRLIRGDGRRSNYYYPNWDIIENSKEASGRTVPADTAEKPESDDGDSVLCHNTSQVATDGTQNGVVSRATLPDSSYRTRNHKVKGFKEEEEDESPSASVGSVALGAPSTSASASSPDGFEEWWRAYPKQEGYADAKQEYALALKSHGVTPALLIASAIQYAEARENENSKYTKFPVTWLLKQCWNDNPQPQKAKSAKKPSAKTTASKLKPAKKSNANTTARKSKPSKKRSAKATAKRVKPTKKSSAKTLAAKKPSTPRVKKPPTARKPNVAGIIIGDYQQFIASYCEFLGLDDVALANATDIPHDKIKMFIERGSDGILTNNELALLRTSLVYFTMYYPDLLFGDVSDDYGILVRQNSCEFSTKQYAWQPPSYFIKQSGRDDHPLKPIENDWRHF